MIETRKLPPRLPSAVWLENDVDRLEDPDRFFGADDSDVCIDLLLGVRLLPAHDGCLIVGGVIM